MKIYRPKFFKAFELVDPITYSKFGEEAIAIFRPEILIALDTIREMTGRAITVNNWKSGGPFKWRGLRTENCKEGAAYSMHRFGGAFDFDAAGLTADEVRAWIRLTRPTSPDIANGVTRMETGVNWCHIDSQPTEGGKLVEFKP